MNFRYVSQTTAINIGCRLAAMVHLTLRLLTGTAALVSQVTGAVRAAIALVQIAAILHVEVLVHLVVIIVNGRLTACVLQDLEAKPVAHKDCKPFVQAAVAIAPANVPNTAAVPLRIPVVLPGVCRHCEP